MLKIKEEFKELKEKYPKANSKIAWSIFFIEDNTRANPLRNMSKEDRIKEVKKTYYDIDVEEHKDLLRAYARLCLTREQTMYKIQQEKMDEITSYLRDLGLEEEVEFNKTMKIFGNLEKFWKGISYAYSKMVESDSKLETRGGIKESYREKGVDN